MRVAKWGMIATSLLLCALGAALLADPDVSMLALGRALGAAMLVFGAVKLVGYFSKDLYRLAFQYDREFGVLLMVLGAIVLIRPTEVLNFLLAALGIVILADSLLKLRVSTDARRFGIGTWWVILALAIATGAGGLALVFLPRESARFLAVWLGISLLAEGVLNLWVALSTVKIIRHQRPDVIEADYFEKGDDTL